MTKTYGICRIHGEGNGTVYLKINHEQWEFPANLTHLERTDSQIFGGFCYSIMQLPQLAGFAQSEGMIRVKDQHKNHYGILYCKPPEDLEMNCCEQRDNCPYITGIIAETASYKYDHFIKRFFKRITGRKQRITNIQPSDNLKINLFHTEDAFEYGEHVIRKTDQALNNQQKNNMCTSRQMTQVNCDLTYEAPEESTPTSNREYQPIGAVIFPFCEYIPAQNNPGTVSVETERETIPENEIFGGWISGLQTYLNSEMNLEFRQLIFQGTEYGICVRSSRRNSLFCTIGGPGDNTIPMREIEKRIMKAVEGEDEGTGISDQLCTAFDRIGFQYEVPELQADNIIPEMRTELNHAIREFWEKINH